MNSFRVCSLRRRAPWRRAGAGAFTLIELLVVLVVIALLAALLLPALVRQRQLVQGLQCTSNLKQLGQAFKLRSAWSGGATNSVAAPELLSAEQTFGRFLGLSNGTNRLEMERDLSCTPKTLICPADTRRPMRSFQEPIQSGNLSYFINVDLRDDAPQLFWAGDRNLTNSKGMQSNLMVLKPTCAVGWTPELHNRRGHILQGDGCVQPLHDSGLRGALQKSGLTNRLAVP